MRKSARLAPWGLFGKELGADAFAARYSERLDGIGVGALARQFHAISRRHGDARLVLLCFEDVLGSGPAESCHRRTFADWWQERTGQTVPELSWIVGADRKPVVVR